MVTAVTVHACARPAPAVFAAEACCLSTDGGITVVRVLILTVAFMSSVAQPAGSAGNAPDAELASARSLLVAYLNDFADGSYAKVAPYLSDGSWSVLRSWNPSLAASDSLRLMEAGCRDNGLQCLRVRTVEIGEHVGDGEFRIPVTFTDRDGTQFVRGPCCGATVAEDPPDSVFTYTVHMSNGRTVVQELPPYVP